MLKKIMLGIFAAILLAGVVILTIQEQANAAATRERRTAGNRDQGPPGGPGGMRGGLEPWLDELTKAYEQNDREKMGQLIEEMKQRRQRFQRGMGRPGGPPEGFGRPGPRMQAAAGDEFFPNAVMAKNEVEKKILAVLDDLNKNQRRGMMNVPVLDGRLLRLLTETMGAKRVVEIGTSNGYSGIWLCLALQKTGGKLTTYEIDERRASLARENFKRAGVDKLVTLIDGDAHKEVTKLKEPIDLLFIDADKEGYIDYLNKLLPLVRPGGLIVGHNINERQADPRYIEAITKNATLESLLLHGQVSVTLKKR